MSVMSDAVSFVPVNMAAAESPEPSLASGCFDPLRHVAWDGLLAAFPSATFFHTAAWARVLASTYGHQTVYFASGTCGRDQMILPVMEVNSMFTGRRGVALPFTDECSPLGGSPSEAGRLYEQVLAHGRAKRWRYLELRGGVGSWPGATASVEYFGHDLDLTQGESKLFESLDSAVRRGIRKARNAGLVSERSTSLESVQTFYRLHCITRRRQGVPPQSFAFFANICRHVLKPGHGTVFTVSHAGRPIAAAVFFHHARHVIYKFGASDLGFQELRPNNLLMWEAIQHYSSLGFARLDFGRTALDNAGLSRFKRGFGAAERRIQYARYDFSEEKFVTESGSAVGRFGWVVRSLPAPFSRLAGKLLYRHRS